MKTLLTYGNTGGRLLRSYILRNGLPPIHDDSVVENYIDPTTNTTNVTLLCLSPDKQKLLGVSGQSGANAFWVWPDVTDRTTYVTPLATFPSAPNAGACSNTYYAVGGGSPFLYVFDWATHSLQTIATTGLGTVRGIAFSGDGSKMAVVHTTSPYLRVYDTATWSYIDATDPAGAGRYGVGFTPDGTSIVTTGASNPYLTVFSADLSTRSVALTSNTYTSDDWAGIMPHWSKPKAVICHIGNSSSSSYRRLYEYDVATGTTTDIIPGSTSAAVYSTAYDPTDDILYAATTALGNGVTIAAFDGSTYAPKPQQPASLRLLNYSAAVALCIIERDTYTLTGTVRDIDNNPASRKVRAIRRSDGLIMAETVSDPITGDYAVVLPDAGPYDMQFMIQPGELLNDLFYARSEPQAVT